MSVTEETVGPRKLPVFSILLAAYSVFFNNLALYARLVWIPFVICAVTNIVGFSYLPAIDDTDMPILSLFGVMVGMVAWIAVIPAVTAWHRFIILGADNPDARLRYTVGRTEWSYLGKVVLIYIPFCIFNGVTLFGVSMASGSSMTFVGPVGETILNYAGYVGGLFVVASILLLLPAAAIGKTMTFSQCFRLVKGNHFRLFGLYLLACAPEYLLLGLLETAYPEVNDEEIMGLPVEYVVGLLIVTYTFFTITVSALSISYKYLRFDTLAEDDTSIV